MKHLFDTSVAKVCGIEEAIILENIYFWCKKNEANNKLTNGKPWTYNSVKAFNELFDYMSPSKISRALKNLEAEGFITIGEFNTNAYDHTKWYCITDKARKVFGEESENSNYQNEKSNNNSDNSNSSNSKITITNINTNNKPNINSPESYDSDFPEDPNETKTKKVTRSKKTNTQQYEEYISSLTDTEREQSAKCVDLFIELHKQIDPYYNRDKSRLCWQVEFAKFQRESHRSYVQILQVIRSAMTNPYRNDHIYKPEYIFNNFEDIVQSLNKANPKSNYQKKRDGAIERSNMITDNDDEYKLF